MTPSGSSSNSSPPNAAVAAVANAAAAAQTAGTSGNFASLPANSLPFNMMNMSSVPFNQAAYQLMQQHQQQASLIQQAQEAMRTPRKGAKKQKGSGGTAISPPASLTPAQLTQLQMSQSLPGFNAVNAPYGLLNYAAMGNANGGIDSGAPRGRWSEEMTFRLIDLRTKMDPKFRTIARPDKLWYEITQTICMEFGAALPKQSTKDKWKNLRSSFRLINQGKHPSHYTKDTWPFYPQIERFLDQRAEMDKNPDSLIPTLSLLDPSMAGADGGDSLDANEPPSDDDEEEMGEDDDDDEDNSEAKAVKLEKRGKKRDRSVTRGSGGGNGSDYYGGGGPSSGGMPPELVNALKPKDVTRKERDLAATMRALNATMITNIQESHQSLLQLARSFGDVADRIAPSMSARRHRTDIATQHALRMQEVSMEVEVVRAELKHLPLLVQLFDQYRSFYGGQSDPERAAQFLMERITKNQSVIFIALPVLNPNDGVNVLSSSIAIPRSAPSSSASNSVDPSISLDENMVANSITSSLSIVQGQSTETIGNATRSLDGGGIPAFAHGFAQLYPSFSSVRMSRHWIVNDLFVQSNVRNRGIASLLLTHVRKFALDTGAASMELATQANNIAAQKLYSRLQWQKETDFIVYNQKL